MKILALEGSPHKKDLPIPLQSSLSKVRKKPGIM